jgi:hypothetical protein
MYASGLVQGMLLLEVLGLILNCGISYHDFEAFFISSSKLLQQYPETSYSCFYPTIFSAHLLLLYFLLNNHSSLIKHC